MKTLLIFALSVFSSAAFAAGDAGCGLGSIIIKDNTKVMQVLAATTNATGIQTFGISTGTSNCTAKGLVMNDKSAQMIAESNLPSLKVEGARGNGSTLSAFGLALGCKETSLDRFNSTMKKNYSQVFGGGKDASQVVSAARAQVSSDSALKQACSS
jgi:hypothetical protein